jgi:hypothetical protein
MSVTAVPLRPIKKGSVPKLWIGLGALCLAAGGLAWIGTESIVSSDPATFLARNGAREGVRTTASGLQIETVREGTGASPGPNDMVLIEYEGRLLDGTVFDASARHGGPAPLLVSGVVPGFSEALQLMKKGGQYRIWLPPEIGYGDQSPPGSPIPANSVLDFDVTLLEYATQAQVEAMQRQQMQQQQGGSAAPGDQLPPGL